MELKLNLKRPKWWQVVFGIVGIFAVVDGGYQMIRGIRGLTMSEEAAPLPPCDSADAEKFVRAANELPFTRMIRPREIVAGNNIPGLLSFGSNVSASAMRDIRTCAAAFLQDDQKIHDGAFLFTRDPKDANKLDINVKIRPPDQLAIGNLVYTQQTIKNWNRWSKIAQTDFGKVVFICKQDANARGFNYIHYPEKLDHAPKSISVDVYVQDMPSRANTLVGAGLFIGTPSKDSANTILMFLLTSDGVYTEMEWNPDTQSLTRNSAFQSSVITSGTNNLMLTQRWSAYPHQVRIGINDYWFATRSDLDLTTDVGVFMSTLGDGNRIELSDFRLDKPDKILEMPEGTKPRDLMNQ